MDLPYRLEFCDASSLPASPEKLLTPTERSTYAGFPTEKRRRDWLAGRLAAKSAIRAWTAAPQASPIEVLNDASGRPYCRVPGMESVPEVSISHCAQGGVGAASSGRIGVDWEPIEDRPARVAEFYASEDERRAGDAASLTMLWAVKEAALKLLGLGLRCDPKELVWDGRAGALELRGAALARSIELGKPRMKIERRVKRGCALAVAYTI